MPKLIKFTMVPVGFGVTVGDGVRMDDTYEVFSYGASIGLRRTRDGRHFTSSKWAFAGSVWAEV